MLHPWDKNNRESKQKRPRLYVSAVRTQSRVYRDPEKQRKMRLDSWIYIISTENSKAKNLNSSDTKTFCLSLKNSERA